MGINNVFEKDVVSIVRLIVSGFVGFVYGVSLWLNMRKHVFEVDDSTIQGKANFVGYLLVIYTSFFQIITSISLSWTRIFSVASLFGIAFGVGIAFVVLYDHIDVDLNEEKYHPFLTSCTVLILTTLALGISISWLTNMIIVTMFSSVLILFFFAST